MHVIAVILSLFLAVATAVSASGKLTRMEAVQQSMNAAQVPESMWRPLAVVELVGALGLVVGLFVTGIGIAAAIGFVFYFVGAVVFHVRAGDKGFGPAAFLGVLALLIVVFYAAS